MFNIKALFLLLFFVLAGCSSTNHVRKEKFDPHKYRGHYKVGGKYTQKGKNYKPHKCNHYKKIGIASWYGAKDGFHGKKTANGDVFNKNMLTAAHPTLPMPSMVRVTNLKNKKSVILMVNDRGPFRKNRILDASEKAATMLGFKNEGTAKVKVEYLHDETKALLWKLSLPSKHGAKPHGKMKDRTCSVACYLDRLNKQKGRL